MLKKSPKVLLLAALALVLLAGTVTPVMSVEYAVQVIEDDPLDPNFGNGIQGVYCRIEENGFLHGDGTTDANGVFSVDVPGGMQAPWKGRYNQSWLDPYFQDDDANPGVQLIEFGAHDTRP